MSARTYTVPQPYEIIETLEETITHYFGPNLKEAKIFPVDDTRNSRNNRNECNERFEVDGPEIILRNCQFQDLFERFKKLRSAMSEITKKFKEINLINEKAKQFSSFNDIDIDNGLACNIDDAMKIQENRRVLENAEERTEGEVQEKTKNCHSRVSASVENLPVEMKLNDSTIKEVSNDENIRRSSCDDMKCASPYQPKTTELALLNSSKRLLINLIDKELAKAQTDQNTTQIEQNSNIPSSLSHSTQLKVECIDKINDELSVLKELEGIDT